MNNNNVIILQKRLSPLQIAAVVIALILISDFVIDSDFDYTITIIQILLHIHITHFIPSNILYHCLTAIAYVLESYSIISVFDLSNINFIYTTAVHIISIISIFHFIDLKKLTSRFSTIYVDTLLTHYKEISKAFISVP